MLQADGTSIEVLEHLVEREDALYRIDGFFPRANSFQRVVEQMQSCRPSMSTQCTEALIEVLHSTQSDCPTYRQSETQYVAMVVLTSAPHVEHIVQQPLLLRRLLLLPPAAASCAQLVYWAQCVEKVLFAAEQPLRLSGALQLALCLLDRLEQAPMCELLKSILTHPSCALVLHLFITHESAVPQLLQLLCGNGDSLENVCDVLCELCSCVGGQTAKELYQLLLRNVELIMTCTFDSREPECLLQLLQQMLLLEGRMLPHTLSANEKHTLSGRLLNCSNQTKKLLAAGGVTQLTTICLLGALVACRLADQQRGALLESGLLQELVKLFLQAHTGADIMRCKVVQLVESMSENMWIAHMYHCLQQMQQAGPCSASPSQLAEITRALECHPSWQDDGIEVVTSMLSDVFCEEPYSTPTQQQKPLAFSTKPLFLSSSSAWSFSTSQQHFASTAMLCSPAASNLMADTTCLAACQA